MCNKISYRAPPTKQASEEVTRYLCAMIVIQVQFDGTIYISKLILHAQARREWHERSAPHGRAADIVSCAANQASVGRSHPLLVRHDRYTSSITVQFRNTIIMYPIRPSTSTRVDIPRITIRSVGGGGEPCLHVERFLRSVPVLWVGAPRCLSSQIVSFFAAACRLRCVDLSGTLAGRVGR